MERTLGREVFILYCPEMPLIRQEFAYEGDAQQAAEQIARHSRGVRVAVARIIATVSEPLPDLQWSDGRQSGDGKPNLDVSMAESNNQRSTAGIRRNR